MLYSIQYKITAAITLFLLASSVCMANSQGYLKRAWKEYRFKSYVASEIYFKKALKEAKTKQMKHQSKIGLAFIKQFNEKNIDYDKAITLYKEVLKDGASGEVALLAKSMLADCYASKGDMQNANKIWDKLFKEKSTSIVIEDALLRHTIANMKDLDSKQTNDAVDFIQKQQKNFPNPSKKTPYLSPSFSRLMSIIYFFNNDKTKALEEISKYIKYGTTKTSGYTNRATALYFAAQVAIKLKKYPLAGKYYKMMVLETPNDARSYYALTQAVKYVKFSNKDKQKAADIFTLEVVEKLLKDKE